MAWVLGGVQALLVIKRADCGGPLAAHLRGSIYDGPGGRVPRYLVPLPRPGAPVTLDATATSPAQNSQILSSGSLHAYIVWEIGHRYPSGINNGKGSEI